jgi:methylated-DNA-[protein]-cysteine S-methyltransferase
MNRFLKKIESARATPFQKKVWVALCKIPKGTTVTYAQLARTIGKPKAMRAVANAVGANPFAPDVPCHRVVRSDGKLGGYSGLGGVATKIKLLKKEGVPW